MAEASILSTKPKRKDINKFSELDEKWYSLGTELEIDDEELDGLEEKYKDDPHKRLIKMFGVWLEKGENPTYRQLVEALVNIKKRNVAELLCTGLGRCMPIVYTRLSNSIYGSSNTVTYYMIYNPTPSSHLHLHTHRVEFIFGQSSEDYFSN